MKPTGTHVSLAPSLWPSRAHETRAHLGEMTSAQTVAEWAGPDDGIMTRPRSGMSGAMRVVGFLAFGQSLLFLILFLFLCARAGAAAETKPAEFDPQLHLSAYEPTKTRDPFLPNQAAVKPSATAPASTVVPLVLKLQGILYQVDHPAAMINDRLVTLKKPVVLTAGQMEVEVLAVEITREQVVLQIGEQRVELRINSTERERVVK